MGSYSDEEIRGFARRVGNGATLDSDRQAALERSAKQAGSEGKLLNRLIGGSKE